MDDELAPIAIVLDDRLCDGEGREGSRLYGVNLGHHDRARRLRVAPAPARLPESDRTRRDALGVGGEWCFFAPTPRLYDHRLRATTQVGGQH